MQIENRFLFDWLTFSSRIHTPKDIADLLGIEFNKFTYCNYSFLSYPVHYRLDNIVICYDPLRPDRGTCCNMSGSGCRAFEKYGHGDFYKLFRIISSNYSDKAEDRKMNVSRLDIAHDVFDGLIDLHLMDQYIKYDLPEDVRQFIKPNYKPHEKPFGSFITRCKRQFCNSIFNCCGGIEINFGSPRSNLFIRIYDKMNEQSYHNINYVVLDGGEVIDFDDLENGWVRNEIMLRDKNAISFIQRLMTQSEDNINTITEIFFGLINNTFRFVEPSEDTNIRRWKIASFWEKYLNGLLDAISILPSIAPEVYTKEKNTKYISGQVKNALAAYIDLNGVYALIKMLKENRDNNKPKYQQLINEYGLHDQNLNQFYEHLNDINNIFYDDDIYQYFEEV